MSRVNSSRFKRNGRREQGQAAVFLVLAMGLFLIGGVGFVVDGANLWFHRQAAQTAADAACTAGAMDMLSVAVGADDTQSWIGTNFDCSGTTAPCQYATLNGYSGSGLKANQAGNKVNVSSATFSGISDECDYANAACSAAALVPWPSPYLQISLTDRIATTFMRLIPGTGQTVDVEARTKCGLSNVLSAVPVLVLNPSLDNTMTANSTVSLTVLNGSAKSIQVNSLSATAVSTPSGTVDVSQANGSTGGQFAVAGRERESAAGGTITGTWVEAAGVVSDPFALIPAPVQPTTDCSVTTCVTYGGADPNCPDVTDGCDV
jgi:hypothetical protein